LQHSVITRVITVAKGVFAPGHLGELTRIVPFEMVDAVLAETGRTQQRVRILPSRVVVYLLLAAGLFAEVGYLGVWDKLVAGLDGLGLVRPSGTAVWQARIRVGVAPLRALFDLLRGPAAGIRTAGVWWCGLLVAAIDGTVLDVPDSPGNAANLGKNRSQHGTAGYPQIRLVALVACGTRAVIDAVFGPKSAGETTQAMRLLRSLHAGMIVLLDRGFDGNDFLAAVAVTGADLLVRLGANRKPRVLRRYRDGSYLTLVGGLRVRVIECEITISTTAGNHTGIYRLGTTLLDPQRFPAFAIVRLYHERWEVESTYLEIKSTLLGRRVLRSPNPALIAQEIYPPRHLPGDPDRDHGCRGRHRWRGPRPGQLHHRGTDRPEPDRASRERHRRNHHRPDRDHRTPPAGQPHARPPATGQPPRGQTATVPLRLQESGNRSQELPGDPTHRHPRRPTDLDKAGRSLT
jgi:hypothetical protein